MSKIDLPRKYTIYDDTPKEFHKYEGRNKLSYSQIESFNSDQYKGRYIANYFLGLIDPGNVFSTYGSLCGEYLETGVAGEGLSDFDISVIDKVEKPENAQYEREIVVDLLPLTGVDCVIQGFIDQFYEVDGGVVIKDLKTGNLKKKVDFYGGDDYQQTTLYSFAETQKGNTIIYSGVVLLGRKGNGMEKYPLRLDDTRADIETPYSEERAMKFINKASATALKISDAYKVYNKYFKK